MDGFLTFLTVIEPWHWFSFATALILCELAVLGTYFLLCSGAAAYLAGVALWLNPDLSWQEQLGLWAALSIAGIVGWSLYRRAHPVDPNATDEPLLNNRAAQYIGRSFTLEADLPVGQSVQVKIDDSFWPVRAQEILSAGDVVQVVEAQSSVLIVALAKI